MDSRSSLIDQINLLHEEKEHQKIIALIEGQPPAAMDYELTSLLARACDNDPLQEATSTVSGLVEDILDGALHLRSDEIRKRLAGTPPETRLPPDAYTAAAGAAVQAALLAGAEAALRAGHAVVLDATFLEPARRDAVQALAARLAIPFTGLWLEAPLATLTTRIAARRQDASDADAAVVTRAAATAADPPATWHRIDAATDPVPAARALLSQG